MSDLLTFFNLACDETRLRIMIVLSQEELCVCQLCGILNVSQPKISKHLAKLRDTNFVTNRQEGKFVFYSLNIENTIITTILENIISRIEEYPILKKDITHLAKKNTFFPVCNSKIK